MAPYRPKSLDELNQAYDKEKAERLTSRPAAVPPQPSRPAAPQPPKPAHSIADTVRARENTQALTGAVDDFIKQFSAQDASPRQSAFAKAEETTQTTQTQAKQELEQEAQRAFDDVLSFPEINTKTPEPPVYHRYTHEEAPIKEGDLSGLMDEYIAVMTDQNGEEDSHHSFLRRRKDRRKSRHSLSDEPEAADDLFDLPDPEPASPPVEQLPAVPYAPPAEIPVEEPVAPVEVPLEEPVAPAAVPFEEPAVPVEIPLEEPAVPVETPPEEPAVPVEIPFEEPVAPVEIPFEEPVAPVEIPFEQPAVPVAIPVEAPPASAGVPAEAAPAAPVAPPEPVVPKMPEYTPYRSPVEQPDYSAPQPSRCETKPKRKINMEPEPVFDPRRLFDDLDEEPETEMMFAAPADVAPEEPAVPAPEFPEPVPVDEPESAAPVPTPEPELPPEAPQQFEDIISYSDESQNDRFVPVQEDLPEPEEEAPVPVEPDSSAEDDEYDLSALDLQQEVVIRSSKVKIFFKILVALLMLASLLATAAVGAIRLVLNVNTGKSAFSDYYFFAVSNDYANAGIHSGDLVLAKHKVPLDVGDTAVYVDHNSHSFSFGKNDASSSDPEEYNALLYNLSGIAVQEENVLGAVAKTIPQGGVVVRKVLNDFYKYLAICVGAFFFLLLIRVIFLRKKRRYLTVEELAQSQEAKEKGKKQKPQKEKKAKKEQKKTKASAPTAPTASEEADLFNDID